MRVKLIQHTEEWLPIDCERPPIALRENHLLVWNVRPNPTQTQIAMKLVGGGVGIWTSAGTLVKFFERASDLAWDSTGAVAWLLASVFAPCEVGPGVRHVIRKLETETYAQIEEIPLCVETGGVEYLEKQVHGSLCIATWLEQNSWGYVAVDLASSRQLPVQLSWPSATISPPAFEPGSSVVVACHFHNSVWWNDEEDDPAELPSPGGQRKIGTISVHDLATDQRAVSQVIVDLPPGWLPDSPYAAQWSSMWGPSFTSAHTFKIWLPDHSTETLTLPLSPTIHITRHLSTRTVPRMA